MVHNHLKRLAAPKAWVVLRKERVFITRPKPGRAFDLAMPLNQVIKLLLKKADTKKEVRYILHHEHVLVNGKRVYDHRLPVGFMDVITFPGVKESYIISLSKKGKLTARALDDKIATKRIVKIRNKTRLANSIQVNAYDGTNILVDKADYAVGDSLLIEDAKIVEHLPLKKGAHIILTGGSHTGMTGVVEEVDGKTIVFVSGEETLSTARRHAFVLDKTFAEVVQ